MRRVDALIGLPAIACLLALSASAQTPPSPPNPPNPPAPPAVPAQPPMPSQAAAATGGKTAVAKLAPTAGNNARGEVTFTQQDGGVKVVASLTGLPMGEHGFHIHEKGDCSAPDATSAGGHFNPTTQPHGSREAAERHVGDLGNLKSDPYGLARADFVDKHLSLEGPNAIVKRAVIVHEKADDFKTQPTGDAGGRLACGVIEMK